MVLGEAGDLGEADLMGRQGISDEISSLRVRSVLAPRHTHIFICSLAFLVRNVAGSFYENLVYEP